MTISSATRAGTLAGLLLLGGCSSLGNSLGSAFSMQTRTVNHDIPAANEIDTDRTRKLFLIVVDGLRKQGKSRAALAYLDDYNRLYPNDPRAELLQADCLMDDGGSERAAVLYTKLKSGPHAAAAHAGLGRIAASRRDWPGAVAQFTEATTRDPSNAAYVNDLGFAQIRAGQYDAGITRLQQAAQLDPNNRMVRNNLILGLTFAGRNGQASQMVETISDPAERERAGQLLRVTAASATAVPTP